jgi:hypothetical protein
MTVDERVKQAALEFAQAHPIQWDDFLEKWLAAHPVEQAAPKPVEEVSVPPLEQTVKTQDTAQEEPPHADGPKIRRVTKSE